MRQLAFAFFFLSSLALASAPFAFAAPPQDAVPSAAGTTTTPVTIPPPPSVNDPMLAPVPPARLSISTWREALALLRSRSTDLRTALDEVRKSEATTRIALAQNLPSISGTSTVTHQFITNTSAQVVGVTSGPVPQPIFESFTTPTPTYLTGNIQVVQTLINPEQWHTVVTAKIGEEASHMSVEDIKRTLALGVANALIGVVTAERVAEINRIGFRNALERLELTIRKKTLGAANGLDVVRAQQDVETARATLVTGDESLLEAREALGLAVGIPEQMGVSKDVSLQGLEHDAVTICHQTPNLDERPDVAAAIKKVEIAKRNVDDVYYQFSPFVNVQSTLSTTSLDTGAAPSTLWNLQAVLSVPIWDGGVRYGNLRNTQALLDEAEQALESLRRQAKIQITQAQRNVQVAETSRKVAADARALAAEVDRLTRTAYQEGQGTSLDLVVAAEALRTADVNLALQEFGVVKARILATLSLATCPW
jgi:outer membrane protein, multidrug efflux system